MLEHAASARERAAAQSRRLRPPGASRLEVRFDEVRVIGDEPQGCPGEILLDATNGEAMIAPWLTDDWWMELVVRWADDPLAIHVMPTPGALLHPLVLSQVEMLRRVVPGWRLIGHAELRAVDSEVAANTIAASPYHEIRVHDDVRSSDRDRSVDETHPCRESHPDTSPDHPDGHSDDSRPTGLRIEQVFARIRARQQALGATKPILVRLSPVGGSCRVADRR